MAKMAKAKSKHVGEEKDMKEPHNNDFTITDVLALGGTKVSIPRCPSSYNLVVLWTIV